MWNFKLFTISLHNVHSKHEYRLLTWELMISFVTFHLATILKRQKVMCNIILIAYESMVSNT